MPTSGNWQTANATVAGWQSWATSPIPSIPSSVSKRTRRALPMGWFQLRWFSWSTYLLYLSSCIREALVGNETGWRIGIIIPITSNNYRFFLWFCYPGQIKHNNLPSIEKYDFAASCQVKPEPKIKIKLLALHHFQFGRSQAEVSKMVLAQEKTLLW